MSAFIEWLNSIIWSSALVYLCLGAGLYFTIRSRAVQIRQIKAIFTQMFRGKSSNEGVSSFQALSISLAGRVGVGNIAGVATAIGFGGPGAVVWMWISALLGASTSFVESTLGQIYKQQDPKTGEYRGGPAFFIEKAYRHTKAKGLFKVYGMVFAFVTVMAMSFMLPGIQSNAISGAMSNAWNLPTWITALGLAVILGFIIIGGVKRIAHFASLAVPFMAIVYIIAAILVTLFNADQIIPVIELIFTSAFGIDAGPEAAFGGILGMAVQWGVQRGIYSNEAGQGTGPHAAAAAEVSHPAKQGLVQAGSVYIDTLFVCSATAFMILSTGMYKVFGEDGTTVIGSGRGQLAEEIAATPGETWPQAGLDTLISGFGASFIAISIFLFALTTIVAYYYMAETNLVYLLGRFKNPLVMVIGERLLQLLILIAVAVGAIQASGSAWALGDVGVGLMAWLNIIAILILQQPAFKILRDFERQTKEGLDPVFDPKALEIRNADFWTHRLESLKSGAVRKG
ncbi:alanine/glycine:cation symporter family protein [Brevibacterium sp.]|uniref:alanine/glycine:cation symporter family protein n=1 Tax=Brevibacterium sp. TaxID=1701 RepID=UPI002812297D|nr:alanine/glycine:cation symporter family protein [Brevibacterium sp.]